MAKNKKWMRKVKTVSTYPPPELFTKNAETIAKTTASEQVSPKGIGSGIRMIQFFINRAGKGLTGARRSPVAAARDAALKRKGNPMPEKKTIQRARKAKREGKSPSTQAGEFVRETMEHIREGKHGARSTKQAIAIGLSKARRAGVKLSPPAKGTTSEKTRRSAQAAYRAGQSGAPKKTNPRRSRATTKALKREGHSAASPRALARQAKRQARKRTAKERSAIARRAARTRLAHQSPAERRAIARKAARTRAARQGG
jgi:hypothetical protein